MPKSVSQLNPAEDPQESDLLYVGQIARTPRDRKIGIAALARAFLHRALTHPILSWVPGGDPVRVMARKGVGDANDQVGLLDLQTPFKDARTEILNLAITGTPATATFDLGAHPGNMELFLVGNDASPKLILTGDLTVGHSLKIRGTNTTEPVIVEMPAGTAIYHLQVGQSMVLARNASGYYISVEGGAPAATKPALDGTEVVKLVDVGGNWWKMALSRILWSEPGVDVSTMNLVKYNNGADIALGTLGLMGSYCKVAIAPFGRFAVGTLQLQFAGRSASASNTNTASFSLAGLPAGHPFEGYLSGVLSMTNSSDQQIRKPLMVYASGGSFQIFLDGAIDAAKWNELEPYNSRGILLVINVAQVAGAVL